MPRGGRRPGAGRKSQAELQAIRETLDKNITQAEWDKLINTVKRLANKGNLRATQLLFTYHFGDPYAARDVAPTPAPDNSPGKRGTFSDAERNNWQISLRQAGIPQVVYTYHNKNSTFDKHGNLIFTADHLYANTPPRFNPKTKRYDEYSRPQGNHAPNEGTADDDREDNDYDGNDKDNFENDDNDEYGDDVLTES